VDVPTIGINLAHGGVGAKALSPIFAQRETS
jgi:hypothetical protein